MNRLVNRTDFSGDSGARCGLRPHSGETPHARIVDLVETGPTDKPAGAVG